MPRDARVVALAAALVVVTALLLAPPTLVGGDDAVSLPHADKLVHFAMFALLAWLAPRSRLAWGALAAYAIATEAAQALVPGRSPDAWDLLADALGILVGAALPRPAAEG